ncbi:MAG: hypothetical protein IJO06_11255 [Thermoguttaceae bacterium]|nr:hypothetical protein [Thermoguttaceae bacterium]
MTPQTPPVAPPSDAASTPVVETPETPKRRWFRTLTSKPLLWTVALLAPPLAYVSPIGFFLPELLNGPEIVQFHLPWGPTLLIPRSLLKVAIALTPVVFFLAPPLGTVASVGTFRRSRRGWAKALAALLIVANALMLFFRPICVLLAEVFGVSFEFHL